MHMENLLNKELNLLGKIVKKHYYANHRKYLILAQEIKWVNE